MGKKLFPSRPPFRFPYLAVTQLSTFLNLLSFLLLPPSDLSFPLFSILIWRSVRLLRGERSLPSLLLPLLYRGSTHAHTTTTTRQSGRGILPPFPLPLPRYRVASNGKGGDISGGPYLTWYVRSRMFPFCAGEVGKNVPFKEVFMLPW